MPEFVLGIGRDGAMRITGFEGEIVFDTGKPDSTLRNLLNIDRICALGWQAQTSFAEITKTYAHFLRKSAK